MSPVGDYSSATDSESRAKPAGGCGREGHSKIDSKNSESELRETHQQKDDIKEEDIVEVEGLLAKTQNLN